MKYSIDEVIQYAKEEDVKFIRLAFCDIFGRQKNVSIMPHELSRAFEHGIVFDASAITGFGDEAHSDLFLHPEPDTLTVLPWRPEHGKVIRMFSDITLPDGTPFQSDTRMLLKKAIAEAKKKGFTFYFGAEQEFYLFELDEQGNKTGKPYDSAGYMDIAPDDKGENIRREICLTLEQMDILPESSHHEEGPGQNEIDFRYSEALSAADNALTFQMVVKTIAGRNGLYADFGAKPIKDRPGNGLHINISVKASDGSDNMAYVVSGILDKIRDMTVFLNPSVDSYARLGSNKAPQYVSWANENRSQLIRIPAAYGEYKRAELRSPDPLANPYIAFALIIYAGLYGIENKSDYPEAADINFYNAAADILSGYKRLPETIEEARRVAKNSSFIREHIPEEILAGYQSI
jgi:glutamine synthetase